MWRRFYFQQTDLCNFRLAHERALVVVVKHLKAKLQRLCPPEKEADQK